MHLELKFGSVNLHMQRVQFRWPCLWLTKCTSYWTAQCKYASISCVPTTFGPQTTDAIKYIKSQVVI